MNNLQFKDNPEVFEKCKDALAEVEYYGYKCSGLTFYNCIFDETNERYDITKPHKHKVVQSWLARRGGDVRDGVCYEMENGRIICGCNKKDFDRIRPSNRRRAKRKSTK